MHMLENVLNFEDYKSNDTARVCREILDTTKEGICTGMIYALYENGQSMRAGITGRYREDHTEICRFARALLSRYDKNSRRKQKEIVSTLAMFLLFISFSAFSIKKTEAAVSPPPAFIKIKKTLQTTKKPTWNIKNTFHS